MRDGECAKCGGGLTADHICPSTEIYQTRVHVGDEVLALKAEICRLTAALAAEQEKVKDSIRLIHEVEQEYNQKTNALIERHASQLATVREEGRREGLVAMRIKAANTMRRFHSKPVQGDAAAAVIMDIPLGKEG